MTVDDVPALLALCRQVEDADHLSERASAHDLREMLVGGPGNDPRRRSLVGLDGGGEPRAWAHLGPDAEPVGLVRVRMLGGVHPAWRRRGVGTAVLAWQVRRSRELLEQAGHPLPARLGVIVQQGAADREALAEAAGLVPTRWYLEMVRLLGDGAPVPEVVVPDGLRVVPMTPDLDEVVRRAHNVAFAEHFGFQPHSAEDWRSHTGENPDVRRGWSFVALDDAVPAADGTTGLGGVVGFTVASAYEQDWPSAGGPQGYTDTLGVLPGHRGRGLGRALLSVSMGAFAEDGMLSAALGVDTGNATGAPRLYRALGYVPDATEVLYGLELPASS